MARLGPNGKKAALRRPSCCLLRCDHAIDVADLVLRKPAYPNPAKPSRRNAAFRLKPRRCRMLGGDRAHGPGPPRLERTSACAFAEHPADKLAHSLPGNSKHPGKLAPRPARQIVSTWRPSLSTMGNGEEDFSMKIQGTRSASAALALSPKSVGDPSGRNRPPVCGDDWSLENPFAGFGDRASPFFDVDNSGSPSYRPPATNFSATACAMLNSDKSEAGSRVQAQTRGGPRALPPLDRYLDAMEQRRP